MEANTNPLSLRASSVKNEEDDMVSWTLEVDVEVDDDVTREEIEAAITSKDSRVEVVGVDCGPE